jgi:hypothetical protein
MDIFVGSIFFIVAAGTVITLIVNNQSNKQKALARNAINNSIANLIEKKAISSIGGDFEKLTKTPGYKPVNLVEQAIIAHGFDNKRTVGAKDFHVNLKKSIPYIRTAVANTDPTTLDFETKPKQRISNSSNDDSALILPLVVFGGLDGSGSSHANDTYAGDSDYSDGGFDGSGGSFGGDSGGGDSGGGDGGGGGGGD